MTKCKPYYVDMETTAYCSCGYCCNWEYGLVTGPVYWAFRPTFPPLAPKKRHRDPDLDKIRRYQPLVDKFWSDTDAVGYPYRGLTASETTPKQHRPGPLHPATYSNPTALALRLLQPWTWLGTRGTIAADTDHYPFRTQMHVPGYGWGVVEDTGGAINGPTRLDLYFHSHKEALQWGRRSVKVKVVEPGCAAMDRASLPGWMRSAWRAMDEIKHALL